ncbi:MAG: hypothetical protein CME59_22065 [Halioglobus sp.]|nr:hypothetical protein [Halioglobus sp.]|tara:strand:- start:1468 stop:4602 length:3135 start_codon:yes stop_codon:yes gene_type:complete
MIKRLLLVVTLLLSLVLIAVLVGTGWFVSRVQDFLTPPPGTAGQPSIAVYAADSVASATAEPMPWRDTGLDWNVIDRPPVSARPWTRWWWPGGDVNPQVLEEQLELLHGAGFGGVEVQPFLSGMINVVDNESLMSRVYSFNSVGYHDSLGRAVDRAHALGMEVDLTHLSGWPPGGPEIALEDSPTLLAYGETQVSGGKTVDIELPLPKVGPSTLIFSMLEFAGADFINFPVDHARPLSVVAAGVEQGEHSWNPFNMDDTVTLAPDSVQVITDHVSGKRLRWDAPEGEWSIIVSYTMPSGEVPMGAAQKPQGFVVDHLRTAQVLGHYEFAYGEGTGLPARYGKGLRGFFNDSLEFRISRMTTPDILEEFRQRRGYDLEPYLPVVYREGADNVYFSELLAVHAGPDFCLTPMDDRIRHDYQQTLSDLMIERFIEPSADWAHARGLLSRGQSYGMDIDIIRALGANSIPETEQLWAGGANVGLKFASSAAALYGRPLVSAESFVWINRDYMPTARRIKAAADKLFLAGINHVIYHGTPYPWYGDGQGEYGEEGWQPFSGPQNPAHFSGHYAASNPAIWPDMPDLNTYMARSQHLLRQGRPDVDVLVYYPFLGFHGPNSDREGKEVLVSGSLPDADPASVLLEAPELRTGKEQLHKLMTVPPKQIDPRVTWMEALQPTLDELERRGVSWAWVNDDALQGGLLDSGRLAASGGRYASILLPGIEAMPPATLPALRRQLEQGTPVIFADKLPQQQRSFRDAARGDRQVREGVAALVKAGALHLPLDSEALLASLERAAPDTLRYAHASTIQRYRRLLDDGEILFFGNQSADAATLSLTGAGDEPLWWFDARTGVAWPAAPVGGRLDLSLAGFDSRFLVRGVPMPQGLAGPLPAAVAATGEASSRRLTEWRFSLGDYHGDGEAALSDWREVPELRHAHGPGIYTHRLPLDDAPGDTERYLLDLGLVQGSARVRVNDEVAGQASLPPFTLDITDALTAGDNVIKVEVRAPLRNLFVGRALAGDPLYAQMTRFENALVAAGLLGPVTLFTKEK